MKKVICTYCVLALKFHEIEVGRQRQKHKLCLGLKRVGLPEEEFDWFVFNEAIQKYKTRYLENTHVSSV